MRFLCLRYIFNQDSQFRDLGKSVTASITSFHLFKMPFMMILLRYRVTVSISDGKTKIDDRYWQSMFTKLRATKVSKNTGYVFFRLVRFVS